MGDKSPKSKDKNKKQSTAKNDKKAADAYAKAHPTNEPVKKSK